LFTESSDGSLMQIQGQFRICGVSDPKQMAAHPQPFS
jgi:hypothetical protein